MAAKAKEMIGAVAANVVGSVPHFGHDGYPEAYSKGSQRLQTEARYSPFAQAFRRGQNSTQRNAIHPIRTRSNNQKCGGYTSPAQVFVDNVGPMSKAPSAKQSFSQQRVSAPSINMPTPLTAIPTQMPWNK